MKPSIKAILLACSVSACGFAGVLETLHVPRYNRPLAPVARRNHVVHRFRASKRRPELQTEEVNALIAAAARKHGVPTALVKGIVATESNFRCNAVSSRGAVGLMQLRPSTARQYGADASVPEQNIDAGTRYLRFLIEKYHNTSNPLRYAIAAYDAGVGAVDRYKGVPPFRETQAYVQRVLARMQEFKNYIASIRK
jgi:soluble lytic murein transglycosylase-like protein